MRQIDFIPIDDWLTLQDTLIKPPETPKQRIIMASVPDDWHDEDYEEYEEEEEHEEEE